MLGSGDGSITIPWHRSLREDELLENRRSRKLRIEQDAADVRHDVSAIGTSAKKDLDFLPDEMVQSIFALLQESRSEARHDAFARELWDASFCVRKGLDEVFAEAIEF